MLRFRDGKFKIMQVADVQELPFVSPDTVKLLRLAVLQEQPDLVVFTGDQIYGLLPWSLVGDPETLIRRVLQKLLATMEEAGVPFAVTFGNHDALAGLSNVEQMKLYEEFPHFLRGERRSDEDPGTLLLTVGDTSGAAKVNLLLVDSNGQLPTGEYAPVQPEQLAWIGDRINEQRAEFGAPLPTYVFQHIPVPEFYDVLEPAKRWQKGAKEAFRTRKHEFYVLPEPLRAAGGFLGETPATPDKNSGEFRLLKESGCVKALFVGHDHSNSFVAAHEGIKLVYTQSAGFHAYGPGRKRGVRIISLDEATPDAFETYTVTFDDLTSDPIQAPLLPFVLDRIPSSMEEIKRLALIGGVGLAACGAAAVPLIKKQLKKTLPKNNRSNKNYR